MLGAGILCKSSIEMCFYFGRGYCVEDATILQCESCMVLNLRF